MSSRADYRRMYPVDGSSAYKAQLNRRSSLDGKRSDLRSHLNNNQPIKMPASLVDFARFIAVMMVLVAVLCVVRVIFISKTVEIDMGTQEIQNMVSAEKKTSAALIVTDTAFSQSSDIKAKASQLGMYERSATETIQLEPDVVVTNDEGNLSLSGSLAVVAAR